jgi:hypothetical protein
MRRLLTLFMMTLSWTVMAGPPAGEGVCDSLKGGTPGLYGLCVAFCEAQGLGGPEDPGMPCLVEQPQQLPPPPEAECPCWTVETLRLALPQPTGCQAGSGYVAMSQEASTGTSIAMMQFPETQFSRVCQLQDGISGSVESKFIMNLDDVAVEGCQSLWNYHAQETNCPGL